MAAVTMSPPQVSSIFIGIPALTARSLMALAFVKPPTLLILRLITSALLSAIILARTPVQLI
jgi:hypothetical protein